MGRRGKRWRWVVGVGAVLYPALAAYLWVGHVADRLILHPRAFDAVVEDAERRVLETDGGRVEVWVGRVTGTPTETTGVEGRGPRAYLLSFHGNGDSADNMLHLERRFWAGRDVEVWAMNFPGYGRSDGPAYLDRLAPAAVAVYDALRERAGQTPIIVSGNSLGTTLALHVAAHRRVAGVVLRDPPPLRQLIRGRYGWWNAWLLALPASLSIPAELDSVANARRVDVPGVFVLNADDTVVPVEYQRRVYDAYAGRKTVLTLPGQHNEVSNEGEGQIVEQVGWLVGEVGRAVE